MSFLRSLLPWSSSKRISPQLPPRLDRDVRLLSPSPPPRLCRSHNSLEKSHTSSRKSAKNQRRRGIRREEVDLMHEHSNSSSLGYHSLPLSTASTVSSENMEDAVVIPGRAPPFPGKSRGRELRNRRKRVVNEKDESNDLDDDNYKENGRNDDKEDLSWPFLHPETSRTRAESLLSNGVDGSYLVRTNLEKQLALSLRFDGRVYHYRIVRFVDNADNVGYVMCGSKVFPCLSDLLHFHTVCDENCHGLVTALRFPVLNANPESSPNSLQRSLPRLSSNSLADFLPRSPRSTELLHWSLSRAELVVEHRLGGGQYGDVYRALWTRHGVHVAVKTLREVDEDSEQELVREALLMTHCSHPNLVSLLAVCIWARPLFIVTEYMSNGNLLDFLRASTRTLPESELIAMAAQVAAGMAHLQTKRIVHRDLAARNCLVSREHLVKVGDLGLARELDASAMFVAAKGSKFPIKWTAPEALASNTFTCKSDIWSFGVLIWEMASMGSVPYKHVGLDELYDHLEAGNRMAYPNEHQNCELNRIMRKCWAWQPQNRPCFSQVHLELEQILDHQSDLGGKTRGKFDLEKKEDSNKNNNLDLNNNNVFFDEDSMKDDFDHKNDNNKEIIEENQFHMMLRLIIAISETATKKEDHLESLLAIGEHCIASLLPVTARLSMRKCMSNLAKNNDFSQNLELLQSLVTLQIQRTL